MSPTAEKGVHTYITYIHTYSDELRHAHGLLTHFISDIGVHDTYFSSLPPA